MKKLLRTTLTMLFVAAAGVTLAVEVVVYPTDPNWVSTGNSGGGSSAITATAPRAGNGSLELWGDRTRFIGLGNPYDPNSNLGLLKDVATFTFEWSVATDSSSSLGPYYTPALRLHIWDGTQRSELIWEGAYNGWYTTGFTKGQWYSSGAGDNFWRWVAGVGDSLIYDRSISEWLDPNSPNHYSENAYVAAISVGVGSSVGSGYHAFADNVTLQFTGNDPVTYNFEVQALPSVPDTGASWMLLVTAVSGLAALRRWLRR